MSLDPRTKIIKRTTPWRVVSYDVVVDGEVIGNYRYRKDAVRCAQAHIEQKAKEEDQLWEDIKAEFGCRHG